MKDYLYLGTSPYGEDCVQVSKGSDYLNAMRTELERYRRLLQKRFPEGNFRIKWENHDFGRYGEIVIVYDTDDPKSVSYAYMVEDNLPEYWED